MKLRLTLASIPVLAMFLVLALGIFLTGLASAAEFPKAAVLSPCTNCHSARFLDPKYNEWKHSTHKDLVEAESATSPARRDVCVSCHTAQGFAEKKKKAAEIPNPLPQTCVACHSLENHGKVPAYLRIYGRVALPDKVVVADAGTGAVCMACHNSRRDVTNASIFKQHPAPHVGPQADMLKGSGAIEIPGYKYTNSAHSTIENACVTCHMAPPPPGEEGVVGGHTFKVVSGKVENTNACAGCHRNVEAFNRPALGDFDGNKVIEPVQDEVKGLMEVLKQAIEARMDGGKGGTLTEVHGKVVFKGKNGKALKPENMSKAQYIAAYNYFFVHSDKSYGIHNPAYAVEILQSSYLNLTGHPVPNAYIR